jgi:hypothetical protein
MDEYDGHEDLRGSGRQSVKPYIHGRVCCIAVRVYDVQAVSWTCLNLMPAPLFIAQGCGSYKGSLGPNRWSQSGWALYGSGLPTKSS